MTSLLQPDVDWTPSRAREFLATIDEETDRLNALVGNLLDMSRLQTGALELHARPVGLDEVVPAALAQPRRRTRDAVELDVPETLPRVLADPGLLERALANVDRQRRPRTHRPDRPVRVDAGGSVDGGVDLRVVDRGPGIPPPSASACSSRSSASATPATAKASGSASPSPRASSRRWAARSRSRTRPAAASPVVARLTGSRVTRILVVDDEPQILRALAHQPPRARLRRRPRADRRGGARRSPPASTPTSSSSTSACPASTASR